MADMTPLSDILNDAAATAVPVQNNFQIIEGYINGNELLRADGTKVMTADLDVDGNKIVNLADGTAADDAVNKGQLDDKPPYLVYHGTGTQGFSGGIDADITIDTEVYDRGTVGSVGSAVLFIPETGLYCLVASVVTNTSNMQLLFNNEYVGGPATTSQKIVYFLWLESGGTPTFRGINPLNNLTLTYDFKLYRMA